MNGFDGKSVYLTENVWDIYKNYRKNIYFVIKWCYNITGVLNMGGGVRSEIY